MRKIILLLAFALSGTVVIAQHRLPDIQRGDFSKYKKLRFNAFIGNDKECFYTFGGKRKNGLQPGSKKGFSFRKYRLDDFSLVEEHPIGKWKFKKKKVIFEEVLHTDKWPVLIFSLHHKRERTFYVLARTVTGFGEYSDLRVLASVPYKKNSRKSMETKLSEDSTRILLSVFPKGAGDTSPPLIRVFDSGLELQWEMPGIPKFEGETFYMTGKHPGNDGSLMIWGYEGSEERRKEYRRNALKTFTSFDKNIAPVVYGNHMLFRIDSGREHQSFDLMKYSGKRFHSVALTTLEDKFLLAGLYSDSITRFPHGSFVIALDPSDLSVLSSDFRGFDETFASGVDTEKMPGAKKLFLSGLMSMYTDEVKGLEHMIFSNTVRNEDGSVYVIGEQNYTVKIRSNDGMVSYDNFANEIIVLKLTEDGEIDWITQIPKKQRWYNVGNPYSPFNSYILRNRGDTLHFLFYDHCSNVELRREKGELKTFGNSFAKHCLSMIRLYPDARMEYHGLERFTDTKDLLVIDSAYPVRENEYMVELIRYFYPWQVRFGKISFPTNPE